ncbi:MAG: hypothetical protein ABJK39_14965 [Hyphomicrobiales bacterium]
MEGLDALTLHTATRQVHTTFAGGMSPDFLGDTKAEKRLKKYWPKQKSYLIGSMQKIAIAQRGFIKVSALVWQSQARFLT